MANTTLTMQKIRAIIQLLEKGYSYRGIAKELKINRKPITEYDSRFMASGLSYSSLRQLSDQELSGIVYSRPNTTQSENERQIDFKSRLSYFIAELKRTGVTRFLLWEEYKKEYPEGYSYTQFCFHLKEERQITQATMRLVHKPGELMMADFAGDHMHYVDHSTGQLIECPVFVAVLPFSGFAFAIALPNATLTQLITSQNRCLNYFGGVPEAYKTDNMRQVVTKSCRYEPLFTDAMQQWGLHYNIALLATRVRKPKDKASVENEVRIAYQRIYAPLRDQIFYSLRELNEAIADQLDKHNNKTFQGKDYSRRQLFETQEKPLLQALPAESFILKHKVNAKVQKNYHITLGEDWHHYSVPYTYIGKVVQAVYDADIVEIYFQLKRIALHPRGYKRHGFTTSKEHMPEGHRRYFEQQGWTPDYFLELAAKVGPDTVLYVQALLKARLFTEQTYNACRGLLRLQKDFGPERLELACRIGLKGSVFNYRTIHKILNNNQDKLLAIQPDLFKIPEHKNLRGPSAYK
jgi:transposase